MNKPNIIYKICSQDEWETAEQTGFFSGSIVDVRDGFIHFSTAAQMRETASQHFEGQQDLVLVAVDAIKLGDALKWEVSRGGDLFPHLYDKLSTADVLEISPLPLGDDGIHQFPA